MKCKTQVSTIMLILKVMIKSVNPEAVLFLTISFFHFIKLINFSFSKDSGDLKSTQKYFSL